MKSGRKYWHWIAKQRAEYYASNDTAPEHRNEPVQPIPQKLPTDAQKVALGFALYHDPRLSADSTISCAHCHALNAGGRRWQKNIDWCWWRSGAD